MSTDFDNQAEDIFVINAINTAIAVVNIAEYLVTVKDEVSRVWKRRHTLVTYIFLSNRFLTILYSAVSLAVLGVSSRGSCSAILIVQSTSLLLQFVVLALFSAFRVYALWNRDWRLPLLVFVLNIVPVGTDIYNYSSLRPREPFSVFRCASVPHISKRNIFWIGLCNRFCVILADILVLGSTWMKTLATQRESKRLGLELRISHLLFRDGTVYFFAAFLLNLAQLLSVILSHVTTISPISESSHWQALIPVLISRFILNLRHADDSFCATEQFTQSQADYPPALIGNLGASLWSPFDQVSEEEESSSIGRLEFASTNGPAYDVAQYDCELDQFETEDVQVVPRRSVSWIDGGGSIL